MERKPSGIIAVRNSFLLRQKRFTIIALQIHPNKYIKHKSRCIIKSGGSRRSLYKHTNIPHVMEKREKKGRTGGGGRKTWEKMDIVLWLRRKADD